MEKYEVIDLDNMSIDELRKWYYATVRDILCVKGLNRKEVLLLLNECRLKERLEQFTEAELRINPEKVANDIYDIRDNIICKNCHKGILVVFEDRGGYSVRCDYCKQENNCRCEKKERAIGFLNRGIYKL